MKKLSKYTAENKKQYSHVNGDIVTAKHKIAFAINTSWIYSMHWKDETWIEQAKKDIQDRLQSVAEEHNLLLQANELLNSIEE